MNRALALSAALVSLAPRTAQAQSRPRVALLKVDVVGMNPDIRARFLGVLSQSLKSAGYDVVEPDAQKLMAAGVPPGCVTGACLTELGRALRVQRVVVGGIGAAGSNYDITLTMLETQKGAAVAQSVDHCEVCTLDEGLKTMGRAAETIAAKPLPTEEVPTPPPPPVHKADPQPLLQQPPPPRVDTTPERPWYHHPAVRWSLAGASLVMAGVGIGALAMDGSCASNEKPTCHDIYDNQALGWGLIGGAAVLGGGAVYLFVTSEPQGGQRVALGWSGSF